MKVREWIERLSEMPQDYEVMAVKEGDRLADPVAVMPIETQNSSASAQMGCGPYVRVVKEGF